MRRALLLSAVVGTFLAGLGCRHVGGRCDCTNDPSATSAAPAYNPYPVVGAPSGAPAAMPVPVAPGK
jgi:hypothetical protein